MASLRLRELCILPLVFALTACGGGGGDNGGSGSPSSDTTTPALSLASDKLTGTFYADETPAYPLMLTIDSHYTGPFYWSVTDAKGIFGTPVASGPVMPGVNRITMPVKAPLSTGVKSGDLKFRLCRNAACTSIYPGGERLLPYQLTVLSETNLTPLSPLADAGDWETFQGNASHTGYVPVTLDASKFNRRWKWTAATLNWGPPQDVTVADDHVYIVKSAYVNPARIEALNEFDGTTAWTRDLGSMLLAANPAAASGGRVYFTTSDRSETLMWSLDPASGAVLWKTPFSSQGESYLAPTVKNGVVYTDGGRFGGMFSFDALKGSIGWFANLAQYDTWTPAVDGKYAYAYTGYRFDIIDLATGATVRTFGDSTFNGSYSLNIAPVIGPGTSVIVLNGISIGDNRSNTLTSYDSSALMTKWSVSGRFVSTPAVDADALYILNQVPLRLEARDPADGQLTWSWTPPEGDGFMYTGNVIVTKNLIFVSTNTKTYAISTFTHLPVWSVEAPGKLALSRNGILYINSGNQIKAINLK